MLKHLRGAKTLPEWVQAMKKHEDAIKSSVNEWWYIDVHFVKKYCENALTRKVYELILKRLPHAQHLKGQPFSLTQLRGEINETIERLSGLLATPLGLACGSTAKCGIP